MANLSEVYGTVLLGGFFATILSGIITTQAFIYVRRYPSDTIPMKAIVGLTWILDCMHAVLACTTLWIYMIQWIGHEEKMDIIPIPLAISFLLTALLALIVQCFFAHRIHKLTHNDWRISVPIVVFAFLRLMASIVSTVEMIHLQTFSAFRRHFGWVLTAGLSISCVVDILVTVALCATLRISRISYSNIDYIANSILLYTLQNNSLVAATTIILMICWVTLPNLAFLGIHFVLSKFYVNSFLVTLNFREKVSEERSHGVYRLSVSFPDRYQSEYPRHVDPGNKLDTNLERGEGVDGYSNRNTPSDVASPTSTDPNRIACFAV